MTVNSVIYPFVSALLTLFPVINPLSQGLLLSSYIEEFDNQHLKIAARKIFFNCLLICLGSILLGHLILLLFGLAVPVIQVGGGIIICKTGYDMLMASNVSRSSTDVPVDMNAFNMRLFYPLSFPIGVGPGAISVIFTLMATIPDDVDFLTTVLHYLLMVAAILLLLFLLYLVLLNGSRMMKKIGESASMILNKMIAFLTFCIGIQILVTGIAKIFNLTVL